jgi:predicted DNA-binding antitoxin AbrB/MazE fold protein
LFEESIAMSQIITATFQDGVLKPDQPLDLPPGSRVRLTVEPVVSEEEKDKAWEEWDKLCEEIHLDAGATQLTRDQLHERR